MDHAALKRLAKRVDVLVRGDRDHVDVMTTRGVQRAEHLEPRAVGEINVEQHEIRPALLGETKRLERGVCLRHDGEALESLDVCAMDLGDAEVVLDDQNADHRGTAASDGRSAVNTAPPSLFTRSHPPRRCATWRASARPSP